MTRDPVAGLQVGIEKNHLPLRDIVAQQRRLNTLVRVTVPLVKPQAGSFVLELLETRRHDAPGTATSNEGDQPSLSQTPENGQGRQKKRWQTSIR